MKSLDQIKSLLKQKQLRVTQSRLAVATVFLESKKKSLSSEEIFNRIQQSKKYDCDQVSVYRILSLYEEINLVRKSNFQGEASRYSLLEKDDKSSLAHEHFFKCTNCNFIKSLHSCFVSSEEKILEKGGYKNLKHHLEITGLCPKCAKA